MNKKILVQSLLDSCISFFGDSFSDTLVSRERNQSLITFSQEEGVAGSGSENVSGSIFDVDNIERSWVSFSGLDGSHSTNVLTADDLAHVTGVEFDPVGNLVGGKVEFDGVADFAVWVWVSDESAVGVINESEVFVGLFDSDDIHVSSRVFHVGSHFSVNFDHSSLEDFLARVTGKGIVESVSDEDSQWHAFSKFVWTGVWSMSKDSTSFWEHPVVWSGQGFKMFLWSTSSHFRWFFCLTKFL